MFHNGRIVVDIHVREGMCTAVRTQEKRVTARVVAGILCICRRTDQSAVRVLAVSGRDAFRDDGALGVLADVNHLRTCVSLLIVVRHGDRIELSL